MENDLVTPRARKSYAALTEISTLTRNLFEAPAERIRKCLPRLMHLLSLMNRIGERAFNGWNMVTVRRGQACSDIGYCYRACWGISEIATYLQELSPWMVESFEARLALVSAALDGIVGHCWPGRRVSDEG